MQWLKLIGDIFSAYTAPVDSLMAMIGQMSIK